MRLGWDGREESDAESVKRDDREETETTNATELGEEGGGARGDEAKVWSKCESVCDALEDLNLGLCGQAEASAKVEGLEPSCWRLL